MKKAVYLIVAFAFALGACSTHRANFKYSEFKEDMPIKASSWKGEELGQVSGEDGGAIWDNCTEKAKGSVRELIAEAKNLEANALGDIKWAASGDSNPTCKKSWGYFALWPFVLTPLFLSTAVSGTAYKVKGKKSAGLLMLPTTPAEEVAFIEAVMNMAH